MSSYEIDKNSGGTVTGIVTYYPAAGAMRINNTLYYVLKDHLGSASVVTDSSGATVGEDRFLRSTPMGYPFGETRFTTGTMQTDKLFTGQREITGLGIYHYGARFYSPKLGRFLSADTIVPGAFNPQNLNRFSYVRNNPLRYIDPTGHWNDEGCGTGGAGGGTGCELPPNSCTLNNLAACLNDTNDQGGGNAGGGCTALICFSGLVTLPRFSGLTPYQTAQPNSDPRDGTLPVFTQSSGTEPILPGTQNSFIDTLRRIIEFGAGLFFISVGLEIFSIGADAAIVLLGAAVIIAMSTEGVGGLLEAPDVAMGLVITVGVMAIGAGITYLGYVLIKDSLKDPASNNK